MGNEEETGRSRKRAGEASSGETPQILLCGRAWPSDFSPGVAWELSDWPGSWGLRGLAWVQVRPKIVARDSAQALNVDHIARRDARAPDPVVNYLRAFQSESCRNLARPPG